MDIEPDAGRMNGILYFPLLFKYTLSLLHQTELDLHKLHRKRGIDYAKHRHSTSAMGYAGYIW